MGFEQMPGTGDKKEEVPQEEVSQEVPAEEAKTSQMSEQGEAEMPLKTTEEGNEMPRQSFRDRMRQRVAAMIEKINGVERMREKVYLSVLELWFRSENMYADMENTEGNKLNRNLLIPYIVKANSVLGELQSARSFFVKYKPEEVKNIDEDILEVTEELALLEKEYPVIYHNTLPQ